MSPQSKYLIRLHISCSSLSCLVTLNYKWTASPSLVDLDLLIFIINLPSAEVKPANQCWSLIFLFLTKGLTTGTISGKALFNYSDKSRFMDVLIATILRKPSSVKCSLSSIRSNACLNNWKSALFSVFKLNL